MLRDGFRHSIEDTLQIIQFTSVLHLNDDNLIFIIFGFDIYAIKLIIGCLLITFTFQNLNDFHLFTKKYREKTFQYTEISFLTKQSLDCPVKTNISVHLFHTTSFFFHCYLVLAQI